MDRKLSLLGKLTIGAMVLGAGIGVSVLLFLFKPEAKKASTEAVLQSVESLTVKAEDVSLKIPSQGLIAPLTETRATAEVSGKVIWVSPKFKSGQSFDAGEELLQIDPSDYKAALAEAKAALADAELNLDLEKARAEQSERDWKKLGSKGAASRLTLREPHLMSAEARVTSARSRVEKAERDLERTHLKPPYRGRIRKTSTDLGSFVPMGSPLADFYATDYYEVRLPLSLDDFAFVDAEDGDATPGIDLSTRAGTEAYNWPAEFVRVEGEIDRDSRSVYLVGRIDTATLEDNPKASGPDLLTPGLFVGAKIDGQTLENIFRVPRKALYGPQQILVIDDEDQLRFRTVEIIRLEGSDMLLSSQSLTDGERVCVTALDSAIEGMPVRVIKPDSPEQEPDPPKQDGSPTPEVAQP